MMTPGMDATLEKNTPPAAPAPAPATAPGAGVSLGRRTLFGVLWQGMQVLCNRGLNLVGQILLARLFLGPAERGQVALAISVLAIFGVIGDFGVGRFLVRRRAGRLHAWEGVGSRLMLACGFLAALSMAAFAPLADRIWPGNPGLHWMVLVLALDLPLRALMVPMRARLQAGMRFRALSIIQILQGVLMVGGSLGLAAAGFGAWALIWPVPAASLAGVLMLAMAAGWPLGRRSRAGQWRLMLPDALSVLGYALCLQVIYTGDNFMVGRIGGPEALGLYAMAYTVAVQAVNLVSGSLTTVLFPAFTQLRHEPERLKAAYASTVRMLALAALPLCLLPIPIAGPLVALLLKKPEWQGCVPALQVLALGVSFRALGLLIDPLLMAAGSTRRLLGIGIFKAALVLAGAGLGCWLGGRSGGDPAFGAAIGVALAYALGYSVGLADAMRSLRLPAGPFLRAVLPPALASGAAVAAAWGTGRLFPAGLGGSALLGQLAAMVGAGGVAYLGLMLLFARATLREFVSRFRGRRAAAS